MWVGVWGVAVIVALVTDAAAPTSPIMNCWGDGRLAICMASDYGRWTIYDPGGRPIFTTDGTEMRWVAPKQWSVLELIVPLEDGRVWQLRCEVRRHRGRTIFREWRGGQ